MTTLAGEFVTEIVRQIEGPSEVWRKIARERLDTLTKPLGSLGRLEDIAAQMVAIRREHVELPMGKAVYVFAADHGIAAEGVSAYPSAVTYQMVLNFLRGGAAVNVLARLHGVDLHVVDMGVDADFEGVEGLLHRKVARGTANMLLGTAMNDEELARALRVGAEMGDEGAGAGYALVAVGEMGIGNATAASAITCALLGCAAATATGKGTGLEPSGQARKIGVIEAVLAKHFGGRKSDEPLEILRCVGGLEIAAMTGMMLAAARHRMAIVVDGFISTAAAALAVALEPRVRGYLIAGHRSEEPGHRLLLESLELTPLVTLGMRLGEGSGAVLAMPVIESAIAVYSRMATFASARVSEATA